MRGKAYLLAGLSLFFVVDFLEELLLAVDQRGVEIIETTLVGLGFGIVYLREVILETDFIAQN
jgi:hypothetical protein